MFLQNRWRYAEHDLFYSLNWNNIFHSSGLSFHSCALWHYYMHPNELQFIMFNDAPYAIYIRFKGKITLMSTKVFHYIGLLFL